MFHKDLSVFLPEVLFSHFFSGWNMFNVVVITNIMSSHFIAQTPDGSKTYSQVSGFLIMNL